MTNETWQWQEPGEAWKGVGIYHVTLTIPSRQPLLGDLIIPNNDPKQAYVERTELGRLLLDCQRSIPIYHPEIQILQYCLMPDHLHFVCYVRKPMQQSIRYVMQAFVRASKKIGRAYTYTRLLGGTANENNLSSIASAGSRDNPLRMQLGGDVYSQLDSIFTEMPFIRPLSRHGQLDAMIQYVKLNPQRLATKRLKPEFFYVQDHVDINGRVYSAVGNMHLLMEARRTPVHVRHAMTEQARLDNSQPLSDYMDACFSVARQGSVMVSPFISPHEREVLDFLIQEKLPVIYLADNGFRDYYKPSARLFDAVDAGNMLILSPWPYDPKKRHISRDDCVMLNNIAEEICLQSPVPSRG